MATNPNLTNQPTVTDAAYPEVKAEVPPTKQLGEKTHTNISRADKAVIPAGAPLSNNLGNLDIRKVPPYTA